KFLCQDESQSLTVTRDSSLGQNRLEGYNIFLLVVVDVQAASATEVTRHTISRGCFPSEIGDSRGCGRPFLIDDAEMKLIPEPHEVLYRFLKVKIGLKDNFVGWHFRKIP